MTRARAALVVLVALAVAALAVAPAGAQSKGANSRKAKAWPDLVGTWEGGYRFPSSTNTGVDSTETLVIELQDDELLWGYNQFVEADGTVVRIPLRGSIDADRKGFGLAETGGFFVGRITGKHTMTVRFFLVAERFTSFEAKLRRAS